MARTNSQSGGLSGNYLRGVRKCGLLCLHIKTALGLERAKTVISWVPSAYYFSPFSLSSLSLPEEHFQAFVSLGGHQFQGPSLTAQGEKDAVVSPFLSTKRHSAGCWKSTSFTAAGKPKAPMPPLKSCNVTFKIKSVKAAFPALVKTCSYCLALWDLLYRTDLLAGPVVIG